MSEEETIGLNIQIPKDLNWELREEAVKKKITKETLVLLLLQRVRT